MSSTAPTPSSSGEEQQETLEQLVAQFNRDLIESIHAFTGTRPEFKNTTVDKRVISTRLAGNDDEAGIVPLYWQGHLILGMKPTFRCSWDSTKTFLAVESSSFAIHPQAKNESEPLFRFEYDRHKSKYPSSHIHVHAHRDEVTHYLGLTKKLDVEKDKKLRDFTSDFPRLSSLHFTTGGRRFRPSMEDVLEGLRKEFDLDTDAQRWREHLDKTRLKWREIQTAAAVRDNPRAAYEVLVEEFGMPEPEDWTSPEPNIAKLLRN